MQNIPFFIFSLLPQKMKDYKSHDTLAIPECKDKAILLKYIREAWLAQNKSLRA